MVLLETGQERDQPMSAYETVTQPHRARVYPHAPYFEPLDMLAAALAAAMLLGPLVAAFAGWGG